MDSDPEKSQAFRQCVERKMRRMERETRPAEQKIAIALSHCRRKLGISQDAADKLGRELRLVAGDARPEIEVLRKTTEIEDLENEVYAFWYHVDKLDPDAEDPTGDYIAAKRIGDQLFNRIMTLRNERAEAQRRHIAAWNSEFAEGNAMYAEAEALDVKALDGVAKNLTGAMRKAESFITEHEARVEREKEEHERAMSEQYFKEQAESETARLERESKEKWGKISKLAHKSFKMRQAEHEAGRLLEPPDFDVELKKAEQIYNDIEAEKAGKVHVRAHARGKARVKAYTRSRPGGDEQGSMERAIAMFPELLEHDAVQYPDWHACYAGNRVDNPPPGLLDDMPRVSRGDSTSSRKKKVVTTGDLPAWDEEQKRWLGSVERDGWRVGYAVSPMAAEYAFGGAPGGSIYGVSVEGKPTKEFRKNALKFDVEAELSAIRDAMVFVTDFYATMNADERLIAEDSKVFPEFMHQYIDADIRLTHPDSEMRGWGVAGTGGFRSHWVPTTTTNYEKQEDPEKFGYSKDDLYVIDNVYVMGHEFHHAVGSSSEFDSISDYIATLDAVQHEREMKPQLRGHVMNVIRRASERGAKLNKAIVKGLAKRVGVDKLASALQANKFENWEIRRVFEAVKLQATFMREEDIENARIESLKATTRQRLLEESGNINEYMAGYMNFLKTEVPQEYEQWASNSMFKWEVENDPAFFYTNRIFKGEPLPAFKSKPKSETVRNPEIRVSEKGEVSVERKKAPVPTAGGGEPSSGKRHGGGGGNKNAYFAEVGELKKRGIGEGAARKQAEENIEGGHPVSKSAKKYAGHARERHGKVSKTALKKRAKGDAMARAVAMFPELDGATTIVPGEAPQYTRDIEDDLRDLRNKAEQSLARVQDVMDRVPSDSEAGRRLAGIHRDLHEALFKAESHLFNTGARFQSQAEKDWVSLMTEYTSALAQSVETIKKEHRVIIRNPREKVEKPSPPPDTVQVNMGRFEELAEHIHEVDLRISTGELPWAAWETEFSFVIDQEGIAGPLQVGTRGVVRIRGSATAPIVVHSHPGVVGERSVMTEYFSPHDLLTGQARHGVNIIMYRTRETAGDREYYQYWAREMPALSLDTVVNEYDVPIRTILTKLDPIEQKLLQLRFDAVAAIPKGEETDEERTKRRESFFAREDDLAAEKNRLVDQLPVLAQKFHDQYGKPARPLFRAPSNPHHKFRATHHNKMPSVGTPSNTTEEEKSGVIHVAEYQKKSGEKLVTVRSHTRSRPTHDSDDLLSRIDAHIEEIHALRLWLQGYIGSKKEVDA